MKDLLDANVAFKDVEILDMIGIEDQVRVLAGLGWTRFEDRDLQHLYDLGCQSWSKVTEAGDSYVAVAVSDRVSDQTSRLLDLINDVAWAERCGVLRVVARLLPQLPVGGDGR